MISFYLKEVKYISLYQILTRCKDIPKKKDPKDVAKVRLDLSQYVKSDGSEPILLPFKKKLKTPPSLEVTIRSHWVKYNNKVLIR